MSPCCVLHLLTSSKVQAIPNSVAPSVWYGQGGRMIDGAVSLGWGDSAVMMSKESACLWSSGSSQPLIIFNSLRFRQGLANESAGGANLLVFARVSRRCGCCGCCSTRAHQSELKSMPGRMRISQKWKWAVTGMVDFTTALRIMPLPQQPGGRWSHGTAVQENKHIVGFSYIWQQKWKYVFCQHKILHLINPCPYSKYNSHPFPLKN